MHIEPGLVDGAKLALSYTTAAACIGYTAKLSADAIRKDGAAALLLRAALATALVFCFFEVLPHHPVGVSEVHLILGTTLMLLFGAVGTVWFVGAGPGDPELITVKGRSLIERLPGPSCLQVRWSMRRVTRWATARLHHCRQQGHDAGADGGLAHRPGAAARRGHPPADGRPCLVWRAD
jgi:hypothetical protein